MEKLERLKLRRMNELQQQLQEQAQEQEVLAQINELERAVKARMTKEAISRFGNVKSAHPERAVQALLVLSQLKISRIDDETLKQVLIELNQKRDITIKRK